MVTYISLFSGAGIGCYGFKAEGFECVATNELIARRLDIQRFNGKCKYESGYICGNITDDEIKRQLFDQIDLWKAREHMPRVDVVIATPPCQGMSVANHKKTSTEIIRNSLVIESIKIIREVNPKFFVFENVPAFMKTICTDIDGVDKPISEAILSNLGDTYSYSSQVINFKDYGACSSRQRTLVIGVANDYANEISPLELYPPLVPEKTLREVIGGLRPLEKFGQIDESDIYHAFRTYPENMRTWIADLDEGESAFDNEEDEKKPHQIIDGRIVINQRKNGDKYKRQHWDKVGPCIHTRNDLLASQNTIHPHDDRVFSIRELMLMMTVPESFRWTSDDISSLNALPLEDKAAFLKKEEIKIRQSLGEAVPTVIFKEVAAKIHKALQIQPLNGAQINKILEKYNFAGTDELIRFIEDNPLNLSVSALSRIAELSNTKRTDRAAYFTSKPLITEMMKRLPDSGKDVVTILEPSAGVGNFIPLLVEKFKGKEIHIDAVDIDGDSIRILKALLNHYTIPDNCHINFIVDDFLTHTFTHKYDYIIGNPPFCKMGSRDKQTEVYRSRAKNKDTTNICSFFLDKAVEIGDYVAMVFPKFLLNTPEFAATRTYLGKKAVDCIIDFGEKGFPGVLVETIAVFINNQAGISGTRVVSVTRKIDIMQRQKYIFDDKYPYWLIYRNAEFDRVADKLEFNMFTVFRDRQITNKMLHKNDGIRVIKSRNISDDGGSIIDIAGYDSYIDRGEAASLSVYPFLDRDDVYLTPNMTYNPRVIRKPRGILVNGSVAVLIPKFEGELSDAQMRYFSTAEYRNFYQTARNYQTRSLNVDACSVFFYGLLKENKDGRGSDKVGGYRMLTQEDIINYCNQYDFDLRESGNGRWIDQKCAADVVALIADCISNYGLDHEDEFFTSLDIWNYDYAVENIEAIFKKPGVRSQAARNEYDKFFQQPMEMLANANVLIKKKRGNRNYYKIAEPAILEYIALRERNALIFLKTYVEKVLRDSGIFHLFETFFEEQTKNNYEVMKEGYSDFIIEHTKINKKLECNRIFIKVLNPLAYFRNARGTESGKMSGHVITYDMLMYNRNNFRDIYADKPKGITRKEYAAAHPAEMNDAYYRYQSAKAKKFLHRFNDQYRDAQTEYPDGVHAGDKAIHMHHIFPEADYPEISSYVENLIALTPTQHLGYAHPDGHTQEIDAQYQRLLLLAKADRIKENLQDSDRETIYEFTNFLFVLYVGFDDDALLEIENMDFESVINAINAHYS